MAADVERTRVLVVCKVTAGLEAKRTKELINRQRIYPPRSGDRREILDASAPVIQAPPPFFS